MGKKLRGGIFKNEKDASALHAYIDEYLSAGGRRGRGKDFIEFLEDLGAPKRHINKIGEYYSEGGTGEGGPFSYEVEVHLQPETTLDWDELLVDHHPGAMEKLKRMKDPSEDEVGFLHYLKGSDLYRVLAERRGSDFDASEALFNAGIHGIRYKDGGSREPNPVFHFDGAPVDHQNATEEELGNDDAMLAKDIASRVNNDWRLKGLSTKGLKRWFESQVPVIQDQIRSHESLGADADADDQKIRLKEYERAVDWFSRHEGRYELKYPKPTYNYVIFHPDFVEAVAQYNIKGEKVKDLGPGVHLKAVDHDPFKGEK